MGSRVHICAAGEDGDLNDELEKHLHPLGLAVTHCGNLLAGNDVALERRRLVEQADAVLFVLSADFQISTRCQADTQLALHRHLEQDIVIAVVRARPCLQLPWVTRFPCLPRDGKSITQWSSQDEALTDIAEGLAALLESRRRGPEGECPFPGLDFFDEDRAPYFFGREEDVAQAVDLLGNIAPRRRWLHIEGASGVGKSSFARAGIIPAVRAGRLHDGPARWHIAALYPGPDPIRSLARALHNTLPGLADGNGSDQIRALLGTSYTALSGLLTDHVPKGHAVLFLVDQLEEVFTMESRELASVDRFDRLLADALLDADVPFYLVTTMRSDFNARFAEMPRLQQALNKHARPYTLTRMGDAGLRSAIEEPARIARLLWEPGLPSRIVRDASEYRGALPLLAHVLSAVWIEREGRSLTNAAYERLGRLGGALARSADALLDSLGEEGRERARNLLLRLVRLGQDGEKTTRQQVPREEVIRAAGGGEEAETVLARLSGGRGPRLGSGRHEATVRLVTIGGDEVGEQVELLHDALTERWETLKKWIREAEHQLAMRQEVEHASRTWANAGRPPDNLPTGPVLVRFQTAETSTLNELAREFMQEADKQRKSAEKERKDAERRRKRRNWAFASLSMVTLASPLGLWVVIKTTTDRAAAEVRGYALQSELVRWDNEVEQQSLLAVEAWSRGRMKEPPWYRFWTVYPPIEVERALYNAVYAGVAPEGHRGEITEVPDGSAHFGEGSVQIAVGDKKVRLLTSGHKDRFLSGHLAAVNHAVYSPDGLRIVTASDDGTVRVWRGDGAAGSVILRTNAGRVLKAAFSGDGRYLVAATDDGRVLTWAADVDVLANMACERAGRNFKPEEWQTYFGETAYRETCDLGLRVTARRSK